MTFFERNQMKINKESRICRAIKLMGLFAFLMTLICAPAVYAQAPESLESPLKTSLDNFICDPYDLISQGTENFVNKKIKETEKKSSAEVAVAIVKDLDGLPIEEYSYQLFKHWGVGKSDKDNGVLFVLALDDRKCRIEVGSGAEGVLTDIACANILRGYVMPVMKSGNLNQAVAGGINEICDLLKDPEAAKELRSDQSFGVLNEVKSLDKEVIWDFVFLVIIAVLVFSLFMLVSDLLATHKRDNYRRAMIWRSHMSTYWWCALLSAGLGLPVALLAWAFYRHSRDVTEICDTCGAKMRKLNEEEDNAFLSNSQDFEEKLGTVDYDVWLCPDCGTVARFPYVEKQLKYKECPECHTIAMNLVEDKVVVPATTRKSGHGERIYQCQYCKHIRREGYEIPKKVDDSAIAAGLAAGAILGSGRGGGGGFGGGGSFGGGSSSGGGASGGW